MLKLFVWETLIGGIAFSLAQTRAEAEECIMSKYRAVQVAKDPSWVPEQSSGMKDLRTVLKERTPKVVLSPMGFYYFTSEGG